MRDLQRKSKYWTMFLNQAPTSLENRLRVVTRLIHNAALDGALINDSCQHNFGISEGASQSGPLSGERWEKTLRL